ncbi:MAG: hypothetical protein ACOCQX_04060 [Candidatus Nanoarchaeia archaeon]
MDEKKFEDAVKYYQKMLGNVNGKNFLVVLGLHDREAFYSIAPLSRAIHEKGGEIHVAIFDGHSQLMETLLKIWKVHKAYKNKEKSGAVDAFKKFISFASKKTGENLEKIFGAPNYILRAGQRGFTGSILLEYKTKWVKLRKQKTLSKACEKIWKQVYNLKPNERVAIGFETIPSKKMLEKPLKDYLDSYLIVQGMLKEALKLTEKISLSTASPRYSMLKPMEKISDLKATVLGCELSKNSNEAVFRRWKNFSRFIGAGKIKHNSAAFFVAGKGYPGKHVFGQAIGYPTPNKKSRWQSPGGIVYQPPSAPQTRHDSRKPKARIAFTETLPLEVFIDTNNINWMKMKERNDALARVARKNERFVVKSNIRGKYKTNFEVNIVKKDGTKREPLTSDVDTRNILDKEHYKKTKIKAGTMGNIPGGEMFITPEDVKGTIVGDVVINIDESYSLNPKNPMIIEAKKTGYKIVKGPKRILEIFNKKKEEARKLLRAQAKIMPKKVIDLKKKNFNGIGEFAINTNPKASVCDYLIVNEKIANMIHVALGSGFEEDKVTEYHSDVVIDAPRQKLDIYALDIHGKKTYVMRKGELIL